MDIKNLQELRRKKLQLGYEKQLAEIELKVSIESMSKYKKPSFLLESALNAMSIKKSSEIVNSVGLLIKLFTKRN